MAPTCCLFLISLLYFISMVESQGDTCNEEQRVELEKYLLKDDKYCTESGEFAKRGSCTRYIRCYRFPNARFFTATESDCPQNQVFDVYEGECVPIFNSESTRVCKQRLCFSQEAKGQDELMPVYQPAYTTVSPDSRVGENHQTQTQTTQITKLYSKKDQDNPKKCSRSSGNLSMHSLFIVVIVPLLSFYHAMSTARR